jgi:hypothetical protein
MNQKAEYKVSFGRIARTIFYEDSKGSIPFTFDVDTSQGRNIIFLERSAEVSSAEKRLREQIAAERTKQHLTSLGYEVRFFPSR